MKLAGHILLGAAVLGSLGFCGAAKAATLTLDLKLDNMPDDDGFVALDGAENMVELTITATGSDQGEVKLSVNNEGATRIKVYDATKTNVLIYDTDKEETFEPREDQIVLYVEGVLLSASVDDVVLTLEWTDSGQEPDPDDDVVKITVATPLVLKDTNSGCTETDLTDSDQNTPELYCKRAGDGKGDVEFWLNVDSGTYDWVIKKGETSVGSGTLTTGNSYKASASNLSVDFYTLEVTKQGDGTFKRRIDFGVVSVWLCKNNTEWTADWGLSSTPDLFTVTTVAGIQIEGVGAGKTVQVKVWSSEDTDHKPTQALTESSACYRNTGTDVWPHFYTVYQAANKRLKITDETSRLHVLPILGGEEQAHLAKDEKVDLAEVAVVDATPTDDAKRFWDWITDNTPAGTQWASVGKRIWSVAGDRPSITDDTCVDFGSKADILYIAGHGSTAGPAAVCGSAVDDPNHPLGTAPSDTKAFAPGDIGTSWNNGELEWLILAVCSQVRIADWESPVAGDNAIVWIKAMPKVHMLLGYFDAAPSAPTDVNIAGDFVGRLEPGYPHDHVHIAWLLANKGRIGDNENAKHASAMVNFNNDPQGDDYKGDRTFSYWGFPTADDPGQKYRYYWIDKYWDWGWKYRIVYHTIDPLP
jgi:hypothetical protein